ncbi:MAG: TonB-dependent hemoglobin/transferrin/lactoferrin family receptor [Pseudomonadota bacterium]
MTRQHFLLITTTAVSATLAQTIWAQDAPVQLPTIVLDSALRDERDLLDTPVTASVIQGDALDAQQANTFEELLGDIPGLTIEGGPRPFSQEPNIRGFQDEQVVLRFDGGRFNFNQAHRGRFFLDPDILQRVEIVRGGGSTLYGSGAIGGVISFETKDAEDLLLPGRTVGARVAAGFADNGEIYNGNVTVFGDWGALDAVAYFSGRSISSDIDDGNGVPIRNSKVDVFNGIVKLGFEPTDEHRFEFSYSQFEDEGTTPSNSNAPSTFMTDVERDARIQMARLSWDYDPAGNDLVNLSVLAYANFLQIDEPRPFDNRIDQSNYDTFGFEVVNRSEFGSMTPVTLVYGLEYLLDEQDGSRNGAPKPQFPNAEAETFSAFAEATISLTDTFDLIAGARYDVYDRNVDDPTLPDASDEFFSPRLGFSFRPTDNWQVYGNVARAFRAPTLTELYNSDVHFVAGPPFPIGPGTTFTGVNVFLPTPNLREEKSTQVELGLRFENTDVFAAGDTLSVSGNVYYADVEDFIDTVVTFIDFRTARPGPGGLLVDGTTEQRNVDAVLYGFEAELDYDAGSWFASAGFTAPQAEAVGGQPLGSIPQTRVTSTFGLRPNADWTLGLRTTFAFDRSDVPVGSAVGEAYQLFDLFAVWQPQSGPLDNAVVRFGVENIGDERYVIFPNGLPQPGRTFKISAAYTF